MLGCLGGGESGGRITASVMQSSRVKLLHLNTNPETFSIMVRTIADVQRAFKLAQIFIDGN